MKYFCRREGLLFMSGDAFPQSDFPTLWFPVSSTVWKWILTQSWLWNSQECKRLATVPSTKIGICWTSLRAKHLLLRQVFKMEFFLMPDLPDKAFSASFLLVEMTFSGPQEMVLLGRSIHCTDPQFISSIVSEGLRAELWKMVHSVLPLQGREKSYPTIHRTVSGFW